jgi:hypothetical protein
MKNPTIKKTCLNCKKEFETTDSRRKYCDDKCKREFRKDYYDTYNKNYRLTHPKYFHDYVRTEKHKTREHNRRIEKYKNDEDYREKIKASSISQRNKARDEVIALLGSKCANPYNLPHPDWCNEKRVLEVDHINGDGWKERKEIGSSGNGKYFRYILKKIKEGSKDYQLLCCNCNKIKQTEKREFRKPNEAE